MRRDSRLSVALHVLLHMDELEGPVTSEVLGPMLELNPVVLRRTLAGLRAAEIVRAEKGHGGGFWLARPLEAITLADVYSALGIGGVFSIGHRIEAPRCPLERAVNQAVGSALDDAEARLLERLAAVSIRKLADDARRARKVAERKGAKSCTT